MESDVGNYLSDVKCNGLTGGNLYGIWTGPRNDFKDGMDSCVDGLIDGWIDEWME